MIWFGHEIGEKPKYAYQPDAAEQVLAAADTYRVNSDKLIYSYGGKTFLAGYDLYDREYGGRGNIDCSTFVSLVLAGIPYGESPYARGTAGDLRAKDEYWTEKELTDFSALPDSYVGIAERIGHPELAGRKGLDLEKAEALGISIESLGEKIRKSGVQRRTVSIAEHFLKQEACFFGEAFRRPGDLVFFSSPGFFKEGGRTFRGVQEITHVGIVWEDADLMIHCSGYLDKDRAMEEMIPAVRISPLREKRQPAFFARPGFGSAGRADG